MILLLYCMDSTSALVLRPPERCAVAGRRKVGKETAFPIFHWLHKLLSFCPSLPTRRGAER